MRYTICLFALTGTLALGGCRFSTPATLITDLRSYGASKNAVELVNYDAGSNSVEYIGHGASRNAIEHVVHISVDGLRPDAVTLWLDDLPAYRRLRVQGSFTDNARTAPSRGNTLPNHTSQLTSRVVAGPDGHGWGTNSDPDTTVTLHSNRGAYVPSVFDVANAAGLTTALFTSKSKFAVFHRSYEDAIDTYVYDYDTADLTERFVDSLRSGTFEYAFLHLRDTDTAGHRFGWRLWSWHPYARAVRKTDRRIGSILDAIDADPDLRGKTAVIVTADHGGHRHAHGSRDRRDYTIPFYVWGPGIPAGSLYDLAVHARTDPGEVQIADDADEQPIRNGDAANLALSLLGLDPIPGSTLGADVPLLGQDDDRPVLP